MLTRQSANSNRLKTVAQEQSGNGYASAGEVYMSGEKVKGALYVKNSEIPRKEDQRKQNRDQEIPAVDNIKGSTEVNYGAKRRRGRPPKLSKNHIGERSTRANMDMKNSFLGYETKSSSEDDLLISKPVDEIPQTGGDVKWNGKRPRNGVRHEGVLRKIANTLLLEEQANETVNQSKNSVTNGNIELCKTVESESQYQDHEIDHAKNDGMMIDEAGADDDQPQSMCLNIRPPIGSDDSRALPVEKQDGNRTLALDQEMTMESSPQKMNDPRDLPDLNLCATMEESLFVRHSMWWENINTLEIYKKVVQKPHFRPLKEHQEESREALAINLMINFSYLVEKISKLQPSCDISVIEKGLDSLAEFDSHGFDVKYVEARLRQLLLIKQRSEGLKKEYEDVTSKVSNIVDEGRLGHEKISQLRQKIREMEKELGEAELEEKNRKDALSALESSRDAVREKYKNVEVECEDIFASPW